MHDELEVPGIRGITFAYETRVPMINSRIAAEPEIVFAIMKGNTATVKTIVPNRPTVDLCLCSKCGSCIEVAPLIFTWSESGGYIEVQDLERYDREAVEEAMKWCPENCIYWERDE